MKRHANKRKKMNQHSAQQKNNNIFTNLAEHAKQIEQRWTSIYQGICGANNDHPHLDIQHFDELNRKFQTALQRLHSDLESPTLILATTGTTSSGKSTIVNLLCGAEIMPCTVQEMSAGVVDIHHSPDNKRYLNIHKTDSAKWECGEWQDLADADILDKLTKVMESFKNAKKANIKLATPYVELTYPIACFKNPDLLPLKDLPTATQFKLMDLPGLRNQKDNTNAEVIKNCKDALCLVACNMEDTDEERRGELVEQVLEQVEKMGGSPARMLFVLNKIDVFRKDREWQRRQAEHIDTLKKEIHDKLYRKLERFRHVLDNLTYSPLSSLPALHTLFIKIGDNKNQVRAAKNLQPYLNLLPEEVLEDFQYSNPANFKTHDFERFSNEFWKNSHGAEFFASLDQHIQVHFPVLVIPTIVKNFDKEASHAVGEMARTCYSELNSSQENYDKTCAMLIKQNADLRQFLDQAKQILLLPINEFIEEFKKKEIDSDILFGIFVEGLEETGIFQGKISQDKLSPLGKWRTALQENSVGILDGVIKSLTNKKTDFEGTQANKLSDDDKRQLRMACGNYVSALEKNDESRFDEQLNDFMTVISEIIYNALNNQVLQENENIHDTLELIMKHYFNYLREGINKLAPEWSLEIGYSVLDDIETPKISFNLADSTKVIEGKKIRTWAVIGTGIAFFFAAPVAVPMLTTSLVGLFNPKEKRKLPDAKAIKENVRNLLTQQLDLLIEPFCNMILDYVDNLTQTVIDEQERVLNDFTVKLEQAHKGHKDNYEKSVSIWQPLSEQTEQLKELLDVIKQGTIYDSFS